MGSDGGSDGDSGACSGSGESGGAPDGPPPDGVEVGRGGDVGPGGGGAELAMTGR
ncbi:hypothetical protein [Algihabitans sp.]|uniref:hypothetical protein n=1 Tax=Algihabitans sp. TaxID=2821514 RepID=UPI003BA8C1CF